jgi:hypothetical protein
MQGNVDEVGDNGVGGKPSDVQAERRLAFHAEPADNNRRLRVEDQFVIT